MATPREVILGCLWKSVLRESRHSYDYPETIFLALECGMDFARKIMRIIDAAK